MIWSMCERGQAMNSVTNIRRWTERIDDARGALEVLQDALDSDQDRFEFKSETGGFVAPREAVEAFADALQELCEGVIPAVVPMHLALTTQQAADLLRVSRPTVAKLIDEGELRGHRVGRERRVWISDAMAYKRSLDAERWQGVADLLEADD
jgi:excisionase family DNA binding protein